MSFDFSTDEGKAFAKHRKQDYLRATANRVEQGTNYKFTSQFN